MSYDLAQFEQFVLFDQKPFDPNHYDAEYFNDDWRDEGNDYRLETRRVKEGRHPLVIKEVFQPKSVLDVGCGPGSLMALLDEVGVVADGVDFAASCKELAPESVRERITIAGMVDEPVYPDNAYDLVICREMMEHLTVLQVRRLVANICRISSNYVYVTTRFHPNPDSLLSITDEPEVDPSHITLLNQDFMRVLFVLEGFHRRTDLEDTVDWMKKGRVLIYQKMQR